LVDRLNVASASPWMANGKPSLKGAWSDHVNHLNKKWAPTISLE